MLDWIFGSQYDAGAGTPEEIQARQYALPYHWIPQRGRCSFTIPWSIEYLSYLGHCQGIANECNPKRVLDVGCGDGRFLAGIDASYKKGVDLDPRAIGWARGADPSSRYECMDAADLDSQYDLVTAIEVLEHIPNAKVLDFWKVLARRSSKYILVCVPTTQLPLSKKHYRHYTPDQLVQEMEESKIPFNWVRSVGIWKRDRAFEFWSRLLMNRHWTFESRRTTKMLEVYAANHLVYANRDDCCHAILLLERV